MKKQKQSKAKQGFMEPWTCLDYSHKNQHQTLVGNIGFPTGDSGRDTNLVSF